MTLSRLSALKNRARKLEARAAQLPPPLSERAPEDMTNEELVHRVRRIVENHGGDFGAMFPDGVCLGVEL